MILYPYQNDASDAVILDFESHQSTLLVMATGLGKTVVFCDIIHRRMALGRTMVLAHSDELVGQAAASIQKYTSVEPDIEMGDRWADQSWTKSPIVVSSIQTQIAGQSGKGRMSRFAPNDFATLVCDEAHHAPSPSWRKVIAYYTQNKNLRHLGVTATPKRHDKKAMGLIYESVAFEYYIVDGVENGYLVPVRCGFIPISDIDLSNVGTVGGDLNQGQLAEVMEDDKAIIGRAKATIDRVGDGKTLCFEASVDSAKKLCDYLNAHGRGEARFVCGTTDPQERRKIISDYAANRFQFLCNCSVLLEGFDDRSIKFVAPRPTKSLGLFTQMIGRGTRTLAGVIDGLGLPSERKDAIAASDKPTLCVLDFVGNSGKHKLVSAIDVLGGKYSDTIRKKVRGSAGGDADVMAELEAAEQAEREARLKVVANARHDWREVDLFDRADVVAAGNARTGWKADPPTEKQLAAIARMGGDISKVKNKAQAGRIIGILGEQRSLGPMTPKQLAWLKHNNVPAERRFADGQTRQWTYGEYQRLRDAYEKDGWRPPGQRVTVTQ